MEDTYIRLPRPRVEEPAKPINVVLLERRSRRSYRREPLTLEEVSLLLWAGYGVTGPEGLKTCPSAGATYPLELYLVVGRRGVVAGDDYLREGVYHYLPDEHALELVVEGDVRGRLQAASLNQEWVGEAPVSIVIAAVFERTTMHYGERGYRYVYMEAGHCSQNIYLEATALGLGTVAVGAFYDDDVAAILNLPPRTHPLYIMPVGRPR